MIMAIDTDLTQEKPEKQSIAKLLEEKEKECRQNGKHIAPLYYNPRYFFPTQSIVNGYCIYCHAEFEKRCTPDEIKELAESRKAWMMRGHI
jgi:hypothetical protein